MFKSKNRGFTLVELLVVIAIIGVLSSIVFASLNQSRIRANDSAVKSNISGLRSAMELYYGEQNPNSYGTAVAYTTNCSAVATGGLGSATAQQYIDEAVTKSGQAAATASKCSSTATSYVVAVQLKSSTTLGWCVDNTGASMQITWANFISTDTTCTLANTP